VTDEQIETIFVENPKNLFSAASGRETTQVEVGAER
jgi:hypothetical protein